MSDYAPFLIFAVVAGLAYGVMCLVGYVISLLDRDRDRDEPDRRREFGQRVPRDYEPDEKLAVEPFKPQSWQPQQQHVEPSRPTCPPWKRPLQSCLERVSVIIGAACAELAKIKCKGDDALLTADQAQSYLQMHSAFSRHGLIIQKTLREALRDCDRYEILPDEPAFQVSVGADGKFTDLDEIEMRHTQMPYGLAPPNARREVQVDLIIFDRADNVIRAYEVKRGASHFGSYAQRAGSNNVLAVGVYLKSYAEQKGFLPVRAESHLISYYGSDIAKSRQGGVPTLHREQLDKHFGFPIVAKIETATNQFRVGLQDILAPRREGMNDRRKAS